eukprot:CAMPEP_0117431410 /NCGR_PEP_ID=MMETSP0758-20121206/10927_1 /TAXON_ID=63605 /ORGANISM="Percolomonas cosmopolitus, Strain AE-1 (ATCC 50343)" /LENGTH=298 /DNA_ID=CAMNT_0005220357 /DNA_START=334 /DNA_END=1231 /DNA_ORIENTATION=+
MMLLSNHCMMNAVNKDGNTPLHVSTKKGYNRIIKLLLGYGADCDISNGEQRVAVDYAIDSNNEQTIHLFSNVIPLERLSPFKVSVPQKRSEEPKLPLKQPPSSFHSQSSIHMQFDRLFSKFSCSLTHEFEEEMHLMTRLQQLLIDFSTSLDHYIPFLLTSYKEHLFLPVITQNATSFTFCLEEKINATTGQQRQLWWNVFHYFMFVVFEFDVFTPFHLQVLHILDRHPTEHLKMYVDPITGNVGNILRFVMMFVIFKLILKSSGGGCVKMVTSKHWCTMSVSMDRKVTSLDDLSIDGL